jgi:hypothetical protein
MGETSSWIAPPGKGKSSLLTDIGVHYAAGMVWRGYLTKQRGGVLYFALERADLANRRLVAHRLRDELPIDLPIAVARQVVSLTDPRSVPAIVDAISRAEDDFGIAVGLVIFDTYCKLIAAGGGDEGAAKDQNIVIANQRRIIDQKTVHIANIGHTGKDVSRGERGSNAHLADVEVTISGDAVKIATVTKANDQPEDVLTGFRLEPYEFDADEDGEPFRTFILGKELLAGAAGDEGRQKLSTKQRLALDALFEVVLTKGKPAPTEYRLPASVKLVTAEDWRDEMYRRRVLDADNSNPRARLSAMRSALQGRYLIGVRDDYVWPTTVKPGTAP